MKRISTMILFFMIGFYGSALFIDKPEILLIKSKIFLGAVIIATLLKIIGDIKEER